MIQRRRPPSNVALSAYLAVNDARSSHAIVIDPSRTIRMHNGIKGLDQIIGRSSIAGDAENFHA